MGKVYKTEKLVIQSKSLNCVGPGIDFHQQSSEKFYKMKNIGLEVLSSVVEN